MRNKAIEYPHPVLNEYTNDFQECAFSIEVVSHSDNGNSLTFEVKCNLQCEGIVKMIKDGFAKIVLRVTCFRTSFRAIYTLNLDTHTIVIPKSLVVDILDLQAIIVSNGDYGTYSLSEFNQRYFGSQQFHLSKGYVIANEPGIKIKLDTLLEKDMAGVVLVALDPDITEMKVNYATVKEDNPKLTDYIVITLPEIEYTNYAKLRTKKHLKNGIERFLQSSLILPAITEAIAKLRMEEYLIENLEKGEYEILYKGTVWADSILKALNNLGIDDLANCKNSDYELANKILGNVAADSLNNLMQKMTEWSTIRQEDDVL